ncbi:MAG: CHASE2 domain-containing protein, partial [Lachnospiraceae bacterium]|nr:CHASE2 domain-containing protein [Lachnospiraceae bacterium]
DPDGILRHALLSIDVGGEKVYSMAYTTAAKYAERMGIAIREPETRGGYYYVSYSALPEGFYDGYSLADLVNGDIPSDAYEGKVVLIGPYAVGLQDEYFTAIDHSRHMYGMEYQANVIQMILDGNYKGELPDLPQRIVLFVVCFLCFLAFQKTSFKWSSAVMAGFIALSLIATYVMYSAGIVMHPLWFPVGIFALYLVSIVIKYLISALEKQRVTRTFERYVAPEIVAEILKEGTENLSLGGKLCDIAVLFVDVRGFTTMSERLDPEKVVYILNRYLTMASGCVEKNRGTLDKFVGDAMMAFWGAPIPQKDAVLNAVRTAADIVKGAEKVSLELKDEIGEELNVGVGVHYGPAVVGNMGAERHMDYTAIGDTVNTAARLEANAPKGTVYISRSVADALGDGIAYTSLGNTVHLKGKSDFEVLQLDPDHSKFLTNSFNMDS